MYRSLIIAVILVAFSGQLNAQDETSLQNRMALFQNTQTACKARVLMNAELAGNFVGATKASLSDICECAALLTVANVSNEKLNAIVSGDKTVANQVAAESWQYFQKCIQVR